MMTPDEAMDLLAAEFARWSVGSPSEEAWGSAFMLVFMECHALRISEMCYNNPPMIAVQAIRVAAKRPDRGVGLVAALKLAYPEG